MFTGGTSNTAIRSTTFPRRALPMKKRKGLESLVGSSSGPPASLSVSSPSSSSKLGRSSTSKTKVSSNGDHDDDVKAALLLLKASKMFPVSPGQLSGCDSRDEDCGEGGRRCDSPPRINDVLVTTGQAGGEGERGGGGKKVVNDDEEDTRALLFHHIGNRRFRVLVEASLSKYFASEEVDALVRGRWPAERPPGPPTEGRGRVARAVIDSVRGNSPPGRFLVRLCRHNEEADCEEMEDGSHWKVATGMEIERMVHSTFWAAGRYCFYLNRTAPVVVEQNDEEVAAAMASEEEAIEKITENIRLNQLRHLQRRKATTAMVEAATASGEKMMKIAPSAPFMPALLPTTFYRNQIDELCAKASSSSISSSSSVMTQSTNTRAYPLSPPPVPSPTPPESTRTSISSAEGSAVAMAAKNVADSPVSLTPSFRLKVFLNLPTEKFFVNVGDDSSSKNDDLLSPTIDPTPYDVPSNYDVLCGRGQSFFHHVGNRRFRVMIEMNTERYKNAYQASLPSNGTIATTTEDGSVRGGGEDSVQKLIDETLHSLSMCDPPARFLGMDMSTGRWRALNPIFSQLKTEQTFFECLQVGQLRQARQREEELRRLIECQKKRQREEQLNLIECQKKRLLEHLRLDKCAKKSRTKMQRQHGEGAWKSLIECEKNKILQDLDEQIAMMCGGGDISGGERVPSGGGDDGTHQVAADRGMPQLQGFGNTHVMEAGPSLHSQSLNGILNLQSLMKQADDYQIPHQQQQHEISQLLAVAAAAGMLRQLQQQEVAQQISQPLFQAAFASALRGIFSSNNSCGGGALAPQEQDKQQQQHKQKSPRMSLHSPATSLK